jgi:hypothetical protein
VVAFDEAFVLEGVRMAVHHRRRSLKLHPVGLGLLAAVVVMALIYLPGVVQAGAPVAREAPRLPSTIARYSWYTGMLSHDRLEVASLLYQNGVGVEFMDTPT